jgi:hypothetical protein
MSDNVGISAYAAAGGSLCVDEPNVVCVGYKNEYSVGGRSIQDVLIGIASKAVASNSIVLSKTPVGSYVIVTCEDPAGKKLDKCVIGTVGERIDASTTWRDYAQTTGQTRGADLVWKHGRRFTALTPILSIETLKEEFEIPRNMFNSRLCGYGSGYAGIVRQIVDRHPL